MEPDVALATAKRRRLANRDAGTLSRFGDGGKSGPPKSPPGNAEIFLAFRETTQTTAVRTPRFGLKEESGLPLATNGNTGGSDAAFRPQRRVRTSACNERKHRRFGRRVSASKKSPDFRLQRTKMGGKAERNSTVVVEKEPTAARRKPVGNVVLTVCSTLFRRPNDGFQRVGDARRSNDPSACRANRFEPPQRSRLATNRSEIRADSSSVF